LIAKNAKVKIDSVINWTFWLAACGNDRRFATLIPLVGGRARRVLWKLGVRSVEQLLALTASDVLDLRQSGIATWRDIQRLQRLARERPKDPPDEAGEGIACLNGDAGLGALLPLIGGRARRVLRDLGVTSMQQFLDVTLAQVLSAHSSGAGTWKDIQRLQRVVREQFLIPSGRDTGSVDALEVPLREQTETMPEAFCVSFESLVRYWLAGALAADRTIKIMEMRLGIASGQPATLEQCANFLNLTRERVRQVQSKAEKVLALPTEVARVEELWKAVRCSIEEAGGMVSLEELGEALKRRFRWPVSAPPKVLAAVLGVSPDFHVLNNNVTGNGQMPCRQCSAIARALRQIVVQKVATPVSHVSGILVQTCSGCADLALNRPREFSATFIASMLESNESLREVATLQAGVLYSRDEWNLRHGHLYLAASVVLRRHGAGMHFTEVADALRRVRPEEISTRSIHGCLNHCEDVMLWDRGTFIHADHVRVPDALLIGIAAWVTAELRKGVPFVSVAGVFAQFEKQCQCARVPSETALYGCLRKFANRELAYPRYPYIYLRRRGTQHVPAYLAVEEWLREAAEPVSGERLKDFVCRQMGLKAFQFENIKQRLLNVVQNDSREYMHTSLLPIGTREVTLLVSHVQQLLSRTPSLSAAKLYREKLVTCHAMGISGPRMLISVLRNFASETLEFSGLQTVTLQSARNVGEWRGVARDVEAYLQEKKRPCSSDEIGEEFVERRGYRPGAVFSVLHRGNVFRYLEGCLVHRTTIEWDERKHERIIGVFHDAYREAHNAGSLYAELEMVIEERERELPTLASGLPWTETLLADIATKCEGFALLGNTDNALVEVPNDLGVASLEDLVAVILKNEYSGAANHEEFSETMRIRRIVRKNLTPSMLGNQSRVVIADREIMLKELG
jgi:DNA-binding transcriptional regulator YdaS (Cro superfamily)